VTALRKGNLKKILEKKAIRFIPDYVTATSGYLMDNNVLLKIFLMGII